MSLNPEFFLYITYLVTLVELTLGFYMFVNNPRLSLSRNLTLLLIVTALTSLGLGLLNNAGTELEATFPSALLAFSMLSMQPLLILTAYAIFRSNQPTAFLEPSRLDAARIWKRWAAGVLYFLAAFPLLLVLFDLSISGGIRESLASSLNLPVIYYSGVNTQPYPGGYLALTTFTQGVLGMSLQIFYLAGLPIIFSGMLLYFIIFDRSQSWQTRRLAIVLLVTTITATLLLYSQGDTSNTPLLVFVASILYAVMFSLTAYQQLVEPKIVQKGSLVYRITLLVLVVSLPLMVALVLYTSSRAGTLISASASKALQQQNISLSTTIETWLDLNYRILENLASQEDMRSMDPVLQATSLQVALGAFPYMDVISVSDRAGLEIARSDSRRLENNSARLWFSQVMDGQTLAFQVLLNSAGKPALVIARPILDLENQVAGVIRFEASLEEISQQLQTVSIGQTGSVFLVDDQDQLIAHPDPALTSWLRDYGDYPPVAAMRNGQTGFVSYLCSSSLCGLQDEPRTAYVAALSNNWVLVVEQSDTELFAPLRQIQQLAFIMLLIGLILFAGAVTYTVRRGLSPVKILADTVSAIAEGELDRQVPLESGEEYTTSDELGFLAQTFNSMTVELKELIGGLEHRVEERTQDVKNRSAQLEAAAQVARAAAGIRDLEALLTQTTQLISETFGFYHAGIFILDGAREFAVLQASNSEGGQRMLARGHKLRVGQVGIVGFVASAAQPRIALDVGEDAVFFNNPDLPETRSEMALPLIVNNQVIGVLDVQSTDESAFQSEDLDVLQILADQLALAIENTLLLEETNRALKELRTIYSTRTRSDWQDRLRRGPIIYEYNRMGLVQARKATDEKAPPAQPTPGGTPARASKPGRILTPSHHMEVPITFRDQMLGSISFFRDTDKPAWSEGEKQVASEAVAQIAAALENARLLEEAQARTTQLKLLQEVTSVAASHTNLKVLLGNVASRLLSELELLHCGVILLNRHTWDNNEAQISGTLVINESADANHPANQQMNQDVPLFFSDVTQESIFSTVMTQRTTGVVYAAQQAFPEGPMRDFIRQRGTETLIVSPLMMNDELSGFLLLDSDRSDRFYDRDDLLLMDQLSLQISAAMDVAYSFEQTTLRAERERKTSEITSRIRETMDIDIILRTAAQEVRQLLGVPEVTVQLVNPEEETDASGR